MIGPGFPRTQGNLSKESYLTLLLACLVRQAGGELHIASPTLEAIDGNINILIDWDVEAQHLVIRIASPSLIISSVRGPGWTSQNLPSSQGAFPSSSPPQANSSTHRIMSEEEILKTIEERMRKDMLRQWREQGAAAMSGMPPPDGKFER